MSDYHRYVWQIESRSPVAPVSNSETYWELSDECHIEQQAGVITADIEKPPRTIGFFEIISLAFNLLSSWLTVASTLFLGLSQGGSVTVLYGLIVMLVVYGAIALSLSEMAARYPTAGGQYHWTAVLAPKPLSRGLGYCCGAVNIMSRIAITSSITIVIPQYVLAIKAFYDPSYIIQRWHVFVGYQIFQLFTLAYNLFLVRRAQWMHHVGFIISLASLFVISVTCLVMAQPKQSSYFVWRDFINETGWRSNVIVFLTGLVNPSFGFVGLDGAIHLAEDTVDPSRTVPHAICSSLVVGFITAFFFAIAMLYSIEDLDATLSSHTRVPVYEIWNQATGSRTTATTFMVFMTAAGIMCAVGSATTTSRLTWSMARDDAMVLSKYIKRIHSGLGVPAWALLFNSCWVFVIGCVYLTSSYAFSAIVGTGVVAEAVTFAFPPALLMWRGRAPQYLPKNTPYNLGWMGWLANSIVVFWGLFAAVIYSIPLARPVTVSNMNYTSAVLGGMAVLATINWVIYARKRYQGPQVTLIVDA